MPSILWLILLVVLALGTASSVDAQTPEDIHDPRYAADVLLGYVSPEDVDLGELLETELANTDALIKEALRESDRLARASVRYRMDDPDDPLTRDEIHLSHRRLSCSEFVWLVYSLENLDLGNIHAQTKEMAYESGVYQSSMVKLGPNTEARAGDILVYNYHEEDLEREERDRGRHRSGHAVIVVSSEKRIVVGSHGRISTPTDASAGVGYRKLLHPQWNLWTGGRRLRAVYRVRPRNNETGASPEH